MKIITKPLAVLGFIALKMAGAVIQVLAKVSGILAGPFLVFIIGCGIYCAATSSWKSLIILVVIAGTVVAFYMLLGLLLGLVDIAGSGMLRHLRK